jgi:3-dehydrosphinganine reductase
MDRIRDFKGMTAIVTGGSSGIGLEVARALSLKGAKVTLMARNRERLEKAAKDIDGAIPIVVDVSDASSLRSAFSAMQGRIDILVNSAGIALPGRFHDMDQAVLRETIEVNLMGTMNSCSCALPRMHTGGHIVNVSSIAGIVGLYGYTA